MNYIKNKVNYMLCVWILEMSRAYHKDKDYNKKFQKFVESVKSTPDSIYDPLIESERIVSKGIINDILIVLCIFAMAGFLLHKSVYIQDYSFAAYIALSSIFLLHLNIKRVIISIELAAAYYFMTLKLYSAFSLNPPDSKYNSNEDRILKAVLTKDNHE